MRNNLDGLPQMLRSDLLDSVRAVMADPTAEVRRDFDTGAWFAKGADGVSRRVTIEGVILVEVEGHEKRKPSRRARAR